MLCDRFAFTKSVHVRKIRCKRKKDCLAQSARRHLLYETVRYVFWGETIGVCWRLAYTEQMQKQKCGRTILLGHWQWIRSEYELEGCLGIVGQRCLFQLQNNRSHSTHVPAGFTRFWIEITQFGDALPFGARFNFCRFRYKLFLRVSAAKSREKIMILLEILSIRSENSTILCIQNKNYLN